jgi:hypothetical protein
LPGDHSVGQGAKRDLLEAPSTGAGGRLKKPCFKSEKLPMSDRNEFTFPFRHSRANGNPVFTFLAALGRTWMPVFTGMTIRESRSVVQVHKQLPSTN